LQDKIDGFRAVGRGGAMWLLAVYVAFVAIGEVIDFEIGILIERYFSSVVGVPVFLTIFFLNFWICWRLALWLTEPKKNTASG
jgi:hypothetical protein